MIKEAKEATATASAPSVRSSMKITMIGAGAHRLLGILRGVFAQGGIMEGGELRLYDLNAHRSEVMAGMLKKTPEYRNTGDCEILWDLTLEEALEGADVVGVVMPAGSIEAHVRGHDPAHRHGYLSSDNITPNGAMAALRIAPVILNIARKMEQHCPDAWLINFVNPVGILSGMVNNHTSIKTLGVCQGFTNHLMDIPRLFGEDRVAGPELVVEAAGINHLSYVTKGSWYGRDLHEALGERLADPNWKMPELQGRWPEVSKQIIRNSVQNLVDTWNDLGVIVFSSEPDGMVHLNYDAAVEQARQSSIPRTDAEILANMKMRGEARDKQNAEFEANLKANLEDAFWGDDQATGPYRLNQEDIFVQIFTALAGAGEVRIATSLLNNGMIQNIPDRHVVECTHIMDRNGVRPIGAPLEIPDIVYGLSASFSGHQTLVGDALATEDPKLMAQALLAYPMMPFSTKLRSLYRELFIINEPHLTPAMRRVPEYL